MLSKAIEGGSLLTFQSNAERQLSRRQSAQDIKEALNEQGRATEFDIPLNCVLLMPYKFNAICSEAHGESSSVRPLLIN